MRQVWRFCFASDLDRNQLLSSLKTLNIQYLFYTGKDCCFLIVDADKAIEISSLEKIGFTLLSRIFKKDDTGKYENSRLGYQITKTTNTNRTISTLSLQENESLRKEYIHIHKKENRWDQIIDNMNTMGVQDMELYLWNYKAFLLMDVPLDFDMEKLAPKWIELPREREWQQYVSKFQRAGNDADNLEKWKEMKIIK